MTRPRLLLGYFILNLLSFYYVTAQTNPGCPTGWSYFAKSDKCLKAFGGGSDGVSPMIWTRAEEYCNNNFNNGHLACIESEDEITLIVKLAHKSGYDDGDQSRIHIGLQFSGASGWGRPDGSSLTYVRWWAGGSDVQEDGRFPTGLLITRKTLTGYMFVNNNGQGANWAAPFVCQATPVSEG